MHLDGATARYAYGPAIERQRVSRPACLVAIFHGQRDAVYAFLERIGSQGAVRSRVLRACLSLGNTLKCQSSPSRPH